MGAWGVLRQLLAATLCAVLVAPVYSSESTLPRSSSIPSDTHDAAALPKKSLLVFKGLGGQLNKELSLWQNRAYRAPGTRFCCFFAQGLCPSISTLRLNLSIFARACTATAHACRVLCRIVKMLFKMRCSKSSESRTNTTTAARLNLGFFGLPTIDVSICYGGARFGPRPKLPR